MLPEMALPIAVPQDRRTKFRNAMRLTRVQHACDVMPLPLETRALRTPARKPGPAVTQQRAGRFRHPFAATGSSD